MSNYKAGDIDNNVKVAVEKIREAYLSNEPEKYKHQFVEALDIIVYAICTDGYTVTKEGDNE